VVVGANDVGTEVSTLSPDPQLARIGHSEADGKAMRHAGGDHYRPGADMTLHAVSYAAIQILHRIESLPQGLQWKPGEGRVSFLRTERMWVADAR